MAAIEQTTSSAARPARMSAKVDFTAMVDLGFLLITFFMLTTSLSKPNIMAIVMPETEGVERGEDLKSGQAITLLLGANDKIYFYEGLATGQLDSTDFSSKGLRRILLDKKSRVNAQYGEEIKDDLKSPGQKKAISKLYVIIKSTPSARYKNIVDAFDEMKICGIARYVLLDISDEEREYIAKR